MTIHAPSLSENEAPVAFRTKGQLATGILTEAFADDIRLARAAHGPPSARGRTVTAPPCRAHAPVTPAHVVPPKHPLHALTTGSPVRVPILARMSPIDAELA